MAAGHPLNADGVVITVRMHGTRETISPRAAKTEVRLLDVSTQPITPAQRTRPTECNFRYAERCQFIRARRASTTPLLSIWSSDEASPCLISRCGRATATLPQGACRTEKRQDSAVFPARMARMLCLKRPERSRTSGEYR